MFFNDGMIKSPTEQLGQIYEHCASDDGFLYAICSHSDITKAEDASLLNNLMEPEWIRQTQEMQLKVSQFKKSTRESAIELMTG